MKKPVSSVICRLNYKLWTSVGIFIVPVIMVLGLSALLSACSFPGDRMATVVVKRSKPSVTTVEVWTNNASSKREDIRMVDEFNNGIGKKKGIWIEYKILGGDYAENLQLALASDQAPDLFKYNVGPFTLPQLVRNGWVVAIEDLDDTGDFLKQYEGHLQPVVNTFCGKTYCVPFAVTTVAVAYNKDLLRKNGFDHPPETWDEFYYMAKIITKNGKGKEFGFIEGLKANIHSQNGIYQFVPSVGHNEFDPKSGRFTFSEFKPFIEMWVRMEKEGIIFPGCENLNNDQARAQFAEGNIGFKFAASYDVGVWRDQFPTKIDWGICRPVSDPSERYKSYAYQTPSLVFGKNALEIPDKVMEVFKLWNSDETLRKLYEAGKYIPYKREIIEKSSTGNSIKNWAEFADLSLSYIALPTPIGEIKLEGDNIAETLRKILAGEIPVGEGLEDLDRRCNEALDRAIAEGLDMSPYMDPYFDTRIRD